MLSLLMVCGVHTRSELSMRRVIRVTLCCECYAHMRRCQQRFDVLPAGVQILARQQSDQLRGGSMFGRQQIRTARDVFEEIDRVVAQLVVLLKVLEMLGAPMPLAGMKVVLHEYCVQSSGRHRSSRTSARSGRASLPAN